MSIFNRKNVIIASSVVATAVVVGLGVWMYKRSTGDDVSLSDTVESATDTAEAVVETVVEATKDAAKDVVKDIKEAK